MDSTRCATCRAVVRVGAATCAECGAPQGYDSDSDATIRVDDDDDDDDSSHYARDARDSSASDADSSTSASSTTRRRREVESREREMEESPEALKLLYMLSLYTDASQKQSKSKSAVSNNNNNKRSPWIRELPLLVLVYEGIVRNAVFDYDYAPKSEKIFGACPRYLNVSEEGRDDLDDLRELGFITALKVTSETYDHSTLLKISKKGSEFLQRMTASGRFTSAMRQSVDSLVHEAGHLLEVRYDRESSDFFLTVPSIGVRIRSTITDVEDVPYVSSPYIPPHMLSSDAFTPNALNGHKKAKRVLGGAVQSSRDIRDPRLNESILLDSVKIIVTEYVPMGSNEMVSFCRKLGTGDRVAGGMFTAEASATQDEFNMVVGINADNKTKLKVLDVDETRFVNVEADLLATGAPKSNLVQQQIEVFGINFRENGAITYGIVVNGIADRIRNDISVDLLARLLSDVHEDTSSLVGNLFSERQRSMLNITYKGEPDNRDKFTCIIAERATPKLKAAAYMDGEDNENELKQVIGATFYAYDLNEQEVIVFGSRGVVVFGPRTERHHKLLATYSAFQARSLFIKSVFSSCFALNDELKKTRALIETYQIDPTNVTRIRSRLADHTTTVTILSATQQFVLESLENVDTSREKLSADMSDGASQVLYDLFQLEPSWKRLQRRAVDLEKVIAACVNDLESLREMNAVIGSRRKLRINEAIEGTTKNLEDAFRAQARNSTTLEVTQVILSGTLAFDILDRFTGQYLSFTEIRWAVEAVQPYIVNVPAVWFILNMLAWSALGGGIVYLMRYLAYMHCSVETKKLTLNKPIHLSRWRRFIATRNVESTAFKEENNRRVVKYGWTEPIDVKKWKGTPPKINVTIDERYGFILQAMIIINKRTCTLSGDAVWRQFWSDVFVARNVHDQSRELFDTDTGDRLQTAEYSSEEEDETRRDVTAKIIGIDNRKSTLKWRDGRQILAQDDTDDDIDSDEEAIAKTGDLTFEGFVASRSLKLAREEEKAKKKRAARMEKRKPRDRGRGEAR